MKFKISSLILSIVLALIFSPADAQQRRFPAEPPDDRARETGAFAPDTEEGGPATEQRREEVRKKIEAIRIWRLTEELKLDAATAGKLSAQLSSFDQKRREIQREQMQTMRKLRQLLDGQKPEEARIKPLLDILESNHRAMQDMRNAELKGIKEILSIEQQARFLIFQQEFQREMRGMIGNARGGSGPRPGMGQGRGMGAPERRPEQ